MRLPGLLARDHWVRRIDALDPDTDFEEIARITGHHEFPWDVQQALSFALFRTYAVPTIGNLLARTDEFTGRTQKRHDDTVLVLETVLDRGLEEPEGRAAIRRMNQMHGSYDISNDDMLYVLCTFVVAPVRWIEEFGWRPLTEPEKVATVRYYSRLGGLMGMGGASSASLHTTGGLALTIVTQGVTLAGARARALVNADRVQFDGRTYRGDIGEKEFG